MSDSKNDGSKCPMAWMIWPQSLLLLFIRLVWGFGFFQAGWGKFGRMEQVIGFFGKLGIPFPGINAYIASTTEVVGGLLLLFGLCSRLISLPLIFTMIVAFITAKHEAVAALFTSDYMDFFKAEPWPFMFACIIILLFGPGKFSVDGILFPWLKKKFFGSE